MMVGVSSVLPDSTLPAGAVQAQFEHAGVSAAYLDMVVRRRSAYGYGGRSHHGYSGGLGDLGQDFTDLTTVDSSGNIVDFNGNIIGNVATTPVFTATLPSGATVASGSQTQLMTSLANAGIDLAKLAIIQPGTSQAGGSITRQTPGFPVAPIATSTQTGVNVGANLSTGAGLALGSTALLGIGLVALVVIMGGRRH